MKKTVLAVAMVLGFASMVSAQSANPGDRLGWDQSAPSLAAANAYVYTIEADKVESVIPTASRSCTGTTSPFVCVGNLPALTTGAHEVRLKASETVNGVTLTSAYSLPLSFVMRAVPASPSNLRIVPGGA